MYSIYFILKIKHNFYIIYNIMGIQLAKKYILPFNLLLIVILFGVYRYYNSKLDEYKLDEDKLIEGVTNSNCCGGVEAGVHYQETDQRPPEYIRRCFKSNRNEENNHVEYEWDGFPCTGKEDAKCCPNSEGDNGTCLPTTRGGICKYSDKTKIYRRGSDEAVDYIQVSNDNLLDINNTVDMKDYFYKRSSKLNNKDLSDDMVEFLKRRDKNFKFIQEHNIEYNRSKIKALTEAKLKATKEKKQIQIKDTIIAIHLIMIILFALVIKELIVNRIDSYYDFINLKYLEYLGKK